MEVHGGTWKLSWTSMKLRGRAYGHEGRSWSFRGASTKFHEIPRSSTKAPWKFRGHNARGYSYGKPPYRLLVENCTDVSTDMFMELHGNVRGGIHGGPRNLQLKRLWTSVFTFGK